ncbi:MAG: hypothetical protein RIS24_3274 [Verrucomicrobiota bacterium]
MVGVAVVGGQPQWVGDREWEHQRPDVTLNEDRCRVRSGNGLLVKGLFRRLAISLFMHWRLRQPKPHQRSLTDFQSLMGENHLAPAISFITSKHPTPLTSSCIRAAILSLSLLASLLASLVSEAESGNRLPR